MMFSVRIVCADYYLSRPLQLLDVCFSQFRDAEVHRVPVVRIFGATPAGKSVCVLKPFKDSTIIIIISSVIVQDLLCGARAPLNQPQVTGQC